MFFVFECCFTIPFTRVVISIFIGSTSETTVGPRGAESVKGFCPRPLAVDPLQIPGCYVIGTGVACYIPSRVLNANIMHLFLDYDPKLAFVVKFPGLRGIDDRFAALDDRCRRFQEYQGIIGNLHIQFLCVVMVIQAYCYDFCWVKHRSSLVSPPSVLLGAESGVICSAAYREPATFSQPF